MISKKKRITPLYCITVILFLILTVGPFVWAFFISVTPEYEMFKNTMNMLPKEITWDNYKTLFDSISQQHIRLFRGLENSLKAVLCTLVIGVPAATVSAYTLSRMEFKGRQMIKNALLITMVIPVFATIIPLYKMFASLQLLNSTFWLSLVYVSSFLPMSTWLMCNYFSTIPKELEEAALVDGCGKIRTFFQIILPVSYPILCASALIMFLSGWSQFQIPLILASNIDTKPVAIVTSEFMTKDTVLYGITAAAGILVILPPAAAALLFRKFLVRGMTGGAAKG